MDIEYQFVEQLHKEIAETLSTTDTPTQSDYDLALKIIGKVANHISQTVEHVNCSYDKYFPNIVQIYTDSKS